jgi:hypothetical protein
MMELERLEGRVRGGEEIQEEKRKDQKGFI